MSDRFKDAEIWWASAPNVSALFRQRVQDHGLFIALDMTLGFDWRAEESAFPPQPIHRALSSMLASVPKNF